MAPNTKPMPPCPYCGADVRFHSSSAFVYRGTDYGPIYACSRYPTCDAIVGVHKGTTEPLGRLANRSLRGWKKRAHAAFDPIWQFRMERGTLKSKARGATYGWLADQLGIPVEACHIGMFDEETCQRVVAVCEPILARIAAGASWESLGISRVATTPAPSPGPSLPRSPSSSG